MSIQHVSPRSALIASLANDISCGDPSGKYDCAFFLDSLLDANRVRAWEVATLLTEASHTEAHMNVADRIRDLVESEALQFFTSDERGIEHVDELMAVRDREAREDAETISELAA